jgi:glycosyltransferase involved in cell wall biosynthesis
VRVLAVNWLDLENPQAGGAEIHFFEIFKRFVGAGDVVTLVCSGWKGAAPRTTIDGIEVRRVGGRHTFAALGRRAVREALASAPYDVVVEDVNKLPLYLPTLTRLPSYTIVPHLFGGTAFQEASFPVATLVWLAERPISWVYRRSAFHAISESTRDELVQRGVDVKAIRVIYPGVDAEWFTPDGATPRAEVPTFLYVGRLKRYKGIDMALRAMEGVRARYPEAVLQIAGHGSDRARLAALVDALGLGNSVQFLGFVDEEEKRRLLRQAWAHVFPSVKEGWGISNVEASACGTPAIAADSPGLRESVIHEQTGLLVPFGDPEALASAMIRVAGDTEFRDRLGVGGREFAVGLSWERTADQTRAHVLETASASRKERSDS